MRRVPVTSSNKGKACHVQQTWGHNWLHPSNSSSNSSFSCPTIGRIHLDRTARLFRDELLGFRLVLWDRRRQGGGSSGSGSREHRRGVPRISSAPKECKWLVMALLKYCIPKWVHYFVVANLQKKLVKLRFGPWHTMTMSFFLLQEIVTVVVCTWVQAWYFFQVPSNPPGTLHPLGLTSWNGRSPVEAGLASLRVSGTAPWLNSHC